MRFAGTENSRNASLCLDGRGKPAAVYSARLRPSGRALLGDTAIARAEQPPCRMTGEAISSVGSVTRCCIVFSDAKISRSGPSHTAISGFVNTVIQIWSECERKGSIASEASASRCCGPSDPAAARQGSQYCDRRHLPAASILARIDLALTRHGHGNRLDHWR